MNERHMEALEQYGLEIFSVRRGRGAWLCETDQGLKLLREYRGTVRRLEFEDEVLTALDLGPGLRADRYVRSREGSLLAISGDGTRYVLKDWFGDRECDLKDAREIRLALSRLGLLHQALRRIPQGEDWTLGSIRTAPVEDEMERHNRELLKARNYIRAKRGKTEFELCVIDTFSMFYSQALEAAKGMRGLWGEGGEEKRAWLCHGDLDQHHMLMGDGYTAIVEYNRMHLGVQAADLYRFMRKVMEKHGWNTELGRMMLEAYERVQPMTKAERGCLYYLFLYPEKYWKQLNFYYNANKAWIPVRSTGKLLSIKQQQPARERFIRALFEKG